MVDTNFALSDVGSLTHRIQMESYQVMTNDEVQYLDIYSSDPVKIEKAAKLFDKAITVRNLLIEKEQNM